MTVNFLWFAVTFWAYLETRSVLITSIIGSWFGSGPDRGMALVFILAGIIGLVVTLVSMASKSYQPLNRRYAVQPVSIPVDTTPRT